MSNTKTLLLTGEQVIENFKKNFIGKHGNEEGQITVLKFWPASSIEETYRKATAEIGVP